MRTIVVSCFIVLISVSLSCHKDNPTDDGKPPCGGIDPLIVPEPPYNSPIWHPSGKFIGFNHTPLVSITYPYGVGCWGEQHFNWDSTGFWLINSDGTNMRRIFPYTLQSPAWSPDGEWIAFVLGAQIFKMKFTDTGFDTASFVQLTIAGRNFFPAWSPDGEWIVHDRTYAYPESSSVQGIWLLAASGSTRYKISTGRFPDWSPNGENITFVDWFNDVKGGIIKYVRQTTERVLLLHATGDIRHPRYSPDGAKIAFYSNYNLSLIDSTGSNVRQLTTQGVDVSFGLPFSWSPDGSRIVYTVYHPDDWGYENGVLWILDPNTGEKKQLAFNLKPLQ